MVLLVEVVTVGPEEDNSFFPYPRLEAGGVSQAIASKEKLPGALMEPGLNEQLYEEPEASA